MKRDTDVLLDEKRIFKPNVETVERAHVKNWETEIEKGKDFEKYWEEKAEDMHWFQKWDKVLDESNKPFYKWFVNGKINLAYNAVDRWIDTEKRNQVAILYVNERGDEKKLTYYELYREVNKMANGLKNLGVKKGETVSMYLPMCPELLISMLACNKIGAVHSVVYSGLSVGAFVERMNDAKVKILITADGTYRRGKIIDLKKISDEALLQCPSIETVVVVKHTGSEIEVSDLSGREIFYERLIEGEPAECECEEMDSEDPLFILYTSGSTGKPKGVLHTTGGYMVGVATTLKNIFDIHEDDMWWCTGDIGWITGHSYVIYGPLLLGTTTVVYEGAPDYPDPGAWWNIVEKYGVTKFYTAPNSHQTPHEIWKQISQYIQPLLTQNTGNSWRTNKPRSLDVVLQKCGKGKSPNNGHMVADRNRNAPHITITVSIPKTRFSNQTSTRCGCRCGGRKWKTRTTGKGRISGIKKTMACHVQNTLRRRGKIQRGILEPDTRILQSRRHGT